jgi:uncharacterized membrane protein
VRFARLIHRRVRDLGGPAARAACGGNLKPALVATQGARADPGVPVEPGSLPPGLEDLTLRGIAPVDLNDRRQIVGTHEESIGGAVRGFLLDKRGRFTKLNPLGAKGTQPQGINNRGQIVGKYSTTTGAVSENGAKIHGFLLDRGHYLRLDFPGAVTSQAFDINDRGQIVGEYQDTDAHFHGDVWERGRFRTLPTGPPPGSTTAARSPA